MIIDSHAHAWPRWPYKPQVPDATSRGTVEQLLWEMDRFAVDKAVLVSACIDDNDDNNDYGADAVSRYPDRLYQFIDVDCRWHAEYHQPGAAARLAEAADRYHPAGISHYLKPENDGWLKTDEGFAFFAEAERRSLVMSLAGAPIWQEDLRAIARALPRLVILCHHLAGVPSYVTDHEAGLQMVLASADVPNIWIKVSGFYYGSPTPFDYPHPNAIAWFERLYRAFGASRLAWGSDYPVAPMRAYTYQQSLEIVRQHCPFLSDSDLNLVLGETLGGLLEGCTRSTRNS